MQLLKSLPLQLFNNKTVLTYYSLNYIYDTYKFNTGEPNLLNRFIKNDNNKIYTFNTYFIINYLKQNIFQKLVNLIDCKEYNNFFNLNYLYNNDDYYYEEGIYDYAYKINILNNFNCRFISTDIITGRMTLNIPYTPYFKHVHIHKLTRQLQRLQCGM